MGDLRNISKAIIETIYMTTAKGGVCPETPIYLALQDMMTIDQFRAFIDGLIELKFLKRGAMKHTLECNEEVCRQFGMI